MIKPVDSTQIPIILQIFRNWTEINIIQVDSLLRQHKLEPERFTPQQKKHLYLRTYLPSPEYKEFMSFLCQLSKNNLHIITNREHIGDIIKLAGGLLFCRDITQKVTKEDVLALRNCLGDNLYKMILLMNRELTFPVYNLAKDYEQHIMHAGKLACLSWCQSLSPLLASYMLDTIQDIPDLQKNTHFRNEHLTQSFLLACKTLM